MKRLFRALAATELALTAGHLIRTHFDRAIAGSVKRTEAPTGEESFGADLDALIRQWRRRGVSDRDIRMELLRAQDKVI